MQSMSRASILTKNLAVSETIRCNSEVLGFSEGPKKEGKLVTLYFEGGKKRSYTETHLLDPLEVLWMDSHIVREY